MFNYHDSPYYDSIFGNRSLFQTSDSVTFSKKIHQILKPEKPKWFSFDQTTDVVSYYRYKYFFIGVNKTGKNIFFIIIN